MSECVIHFTRGTPYVLVHASNGRARHVIPDMRDASTDVAELSAGEPASANPVVEWSDLTWSDTWSLLTTSQNLPASFWLTQALALIVMALLTWAFGSMWDRYADARFSRLVDRYIDAAEAVARPTARLMQRLVPRLVSLGARHIPEAYRGSVGGWRAAAHGVVVLCCSFLALQFWCIACDAAATKGPHRSELPALAVGAARMRWGCSWLRLRDGALPQRLAALPLEASLSPAHSASTASAWVWWALRPWVVAPSTEQAWDDMTSPHAAARWAAAAVAANNRTADGVCGDDEAVWSLARALLWGRRRRGTPQADMSPNAQASPETVGADDQDAVDIDAVDLLLLDARDLRIAMVGVPLHLMASMLSWKLWGGAGAILTAMLCTFCPHMLAFSALLTGDAVAALLLLAALWALWALMRSESAGALLSAALATAVLLGLLISCGPLAALAAPAAALLIVARAAAALTSAISALVAGGDGSLRVPLPRRVWYAMPRLIAAMTAAISMPAIAGAVVAAVASLPVWPTNEVQAQAEATAWADASARLIGPRDGCRIGRRRRKHGSSKRKKKGATGTAVDDVESDDRLSSRALSAMACFRERGVLSPALVRAAEAAAASGLVPRALLIMCMHHAAAVAELTRGEDSGWDQPIEPLADDDTGSSILYKSGVFALRSEAVGPSIPPFAHFHATTALLKTPPTLLYLLAILIVAALRTPIYAAFSAIGVPLALAWFKGLLRSNRFTVWARRRLVRLMERTEWQKQVDAEFLKLMEKRRGPKSAGDAQASVPTGVEAESEPDDDAAAATSVSRWCAGALWQAYRTAPLWALGVGYVLLLSAGAPPAIGHRLLLPCYPALYILLGALGKLGIHDHAHSTSQPLVVVSTLLLVALFGLESSTVHPHFAGYFAPVAGGRSGGHFHLLGDSLDMGQDLPLLARWLQAMAQVDEPAYLAYCGEDSPRARGIHARRLPAQAHSECVTATVEPFDFAPPRSSDEENASRGSDRSEDPPSLLDASGEVDGASSEHDEEFNWDLEASDDVVPAVQPAAQTSSTGTMVTLDLEAQAELLPGLYLLEANALHGVSSAFKGPWTDMAEDTYQALLSRGLHTRRAASPLRFARLCALLRKLQPLSTTGGTIFIWRLGADELHMASEGEPAEIFSSRALSPGMRKLQQKVLAKIAAALNVSPASRSTGPQLHWREHQPLRPEREPRLAPR